MSKDAVLHVYAQPWSHGEAWVVGTREGLMELRDAINRALSDGTSRAEVVAMDGEGYRALVLVTDRTDLQLPYAEALAEAGAGEHPYRVVGQETYVRLMRE
jgi:hypothetical protein